MVLEFTQVVRKLNKEGEEKLQQFILEQYEPQEEDLFERLNISRPEDDEAPKIQFPEFSEDDYDVIEEDVYIKSSAIEIIEPHELGAKILTSGGYETIVKESHIDVAVQLNLKSI
jgi:hypothetical protein